MAIPVKLPVFEGPLDLLLHLIEKNKIDIYDIPIVEITDQYMDYIRQMEEQDLGVMSEFMVMAATLLDIKCKMLLPKKINEEGEEEDPRAALVEQLLEYKMYKTLSYELRDRMGEAARCLYKKPQLPREVREYQEPVEPSELLAGLTLDALNKIFQEVLRRQEDKIDPIRSSFGTIKKEEVNLPEKMEELLLYAKEHKQFSFSDLLTRQRSRTQVVVTFLAVLELMKTGAITIRQEALFEEIEIMAASPEVRGSEE